MIREAIFEDVDDILDMCEIFWQSTMYTEQFDGEHTTSMIDLSMSHDLMLVSEDDQHNVNGFMACIKAPLLASKQAFMAVEVAFYVKPDSRGHKTGVELINTMEQLLKLQGVKYLNMISMASSMPDKVNALYEKLGYKVAETAFTKILIQE